MNFGDIFLKKGEKERALDYYLEAQGLVFESQLFFENLSRKVNRLLEIE